MMGERMLTIPGVRTNGINFRAELLLEGMQLQEFRCRPQCIITPAKERMVLEGVPRMQVSGEVFPDRYPRLPAKLTLRYGYLFRVMTNAELISGIILATAFRDLNITGGIKFKKFREFLVQRKLMDVMQQMPITTSRKFGKVAYSEFDLETAAPTTLVWTSVRAMLDAHKNFRIFSRDRTDPVGKRLDGTDIEITDLIVLVLAIDPNQLENPLDVNLAYHSHEKEVNETYGLIINELIPLEAMNIFITDGAFPAKYDDQVKHIKEQLREVELRR